MKIRERQNCKVLKITHQVLKIVEMRVLKKPIRPKVDIGEM